MPVVREQWKYSTYSVHLGYRVSLLVYRILLPKYFSFCRFLRIVDVKPFWGTYIYIMYENMFNNTIITCLRSPKTKIRWLSVSLTDFLKLLRICRIRLTSTSSITSLCPLGSHWSSSSSEKNSYCQLNSILSKM